MKLANCFKNRQFTDHISTHEWDGCGPNDWRWNAEPLSLSSAAIVRMPMTDPMCHRSPKLLLSLNEIIEWGMLATTRGQCLIEWRLMGHTMVPLNQAVGGSNDRNVATALAQTANALEPGAEIVLRKNAKGTVKERCDEPAPPKDSPEDPLKALHPRPDEAHGRVQELLQQRLQQILQRGQQERLDVAKLQELQQLLVGLGQCADTQAVPQSPRWSQQSPRSPMSPSQQEPPPACPQQPSTPRPATPPSAPRHNGLPLLVPRQQDLPPRHPPHLQGPVSPAAAYGPTRQRQATPPAERPSTPSTPPRAPGRDAKVCVDELGPAVGAKPPETRPKPGEVSVSRQGSEVPLKAAGSAPTAAREESSPAPAPAPAPPAREEAETLARPQAAEAPSQAAPVPAQPNVKAPTTAPSPEASRNEIQVAKAGEAPAATATETAPAAATPAAAEGDAASGWDSDDDDWRGTQALGSPPQAMDTSVADTAAKPEASTSAVATPPAAAPRDEPLQEKSPSNRSTTSDKHKAAAAANAATKKVSRFSLWGSGSTKSKK
eukprot:s3398_g4.t3